MVKSAAKFQRQMLQRGWADLQIDEAVAGGMRYGVVNFETGVSATRYVHPETGRSVIIEDASGEVLDVGGDDFRY